jgi:hypothetical protein
MNKLAAVTLELGCRGGLHRSVALGNITRREPTRAPRKRDVAHGTVHATASRPAVNIFVQAVCNTGWGLCSG